MKRVFAIFLGILTAIGGFVDIGDLVANAATGARFGMNLAWVVVVGVFGIVVYAEMAGRVAALAQRPVFDLVRERLGPRFGLANLAGLLLHQLPHADGGGGGRGHRDLGSLPASTTSSSSRSSALLVWLVVWRMPFETMERVFGLLGLCLLVFAVAVWKIGPGLGRAAG